jgi:dienelactone hydrolase
MTKQLNIDPKKIIIYGRSIGSGPSVELASKYPVGGLIL